MEPTFEVDLSRLNFGLQRLNEALGGEVGPQLVKYRAQKFLRDVISMTPAKNFGQHMKRMNRDLSHAALPLTRSNIRSVFSMGDKRLMRRLNALAEQSSGSIGGKAQEDLQAIFKNMPRFKYWQPVAASDFNQHVDNLQDSRGRIRKQKQFYMLSTRAWQGELARRSLNIGILKSGWVASAQAVGDVPLDAYVLRHGARWGKAMPNYSNPSGAYIIMENNGVKYPGYPSIVNTALAGNAQAMATQLSRLLQGKAVNLGFMTVEAAKWGDVLGAA